MNRKKLAQYGIFALFILLLGCQIQQSPDIRLVFMTDIHVQPELNAARGYETAIAHVNALKPDFVITGGDLVMDALGVDFGRADSLYTLFIEKSRAFRMPVYHCIGNHEHFGVYERSGVSPNHPEYGKAMFKNRLGDGATYRSFDYKGWHFVLLDGIGITEDRRYTGRVDAEQLEWLKQDLAAAGEDTPVILALHIPLFSAAVQFIQGPTAANSPGIVVENALEVWNICRDYNVKLVLQGHLHIVEDIGWKDTRFVTAGAVCARWWQGPNQGFEEGFALVEIRGDDVLWRYEPYEWDVQED